MPAECPLFGCVVPKPRGSHPPQGATAWGGLIKSSVKSENQVQVAHEDAGFLPFELATLFNKNTIAAEAKMWWTGGLTTEHTHSKHTVTTPTTEMEPVSSVWAVPQPLQR